MSMTGSHHVFQNRHAGEQPNVLKRARHAATRNLVRPQAVNPFALKIDFARSRFVNASQEIEDCGFAGAVWSDQAVDLAALDAHVQRIDSHQSAKLNRAFDCL